MAFDNKLIRNEPYYDDYDPSKNYTAIVAVPGRVEQAREFTQAQTIIRDYLGRLGDSIWSNGSIISGCSLVINGKYATVTEGKIYIDGLVRNVSQQTFSIRGTGYEKVCARVIKSIVTENEDSSLRDIAQNYENAGQAGAHRIKEIVQLSLVDNNVSDAGTVIYTIFDGNINKAESQTEENAFLYETLARRTFDENGSYKVEGLTLIDKQQSDEDGIRVSISEGKAYVKGYEITKSTASTVLINFATATRTVLAEPYTFNYEELDNAGICYWKLAYTPVKKLTTFAFTCEVDIEMSRGSVYGGSDTIGYDAITSILRVYDGGREYSRVTDYNFTSGQYGYEIDWSLAINKGGNQPSTGSTYHIVLQYTKTANNESTDVRLDDIVELVNGYDSDSDRYVSRAKWKNTFISNDKSFVPNNAMIQISYEYYLGRKDLITMDSKGEFKIAEGRYNTITRCESPINQDPEKLVIGSLLVYPGYSDHLADSFLRKIILNTNNSIRLSQDNLQNIKTRVDNLEYDIALSDLDQEAADNEQASLLKGIFTDGFLGLTKCDVGSSVFNCCIDVDNSELTLPVKQEVFKTAIKTNETNNNFSKIGSIIMPPYTTKVAASQKYATTRMAVNPYAVYNAMALLKLDPYLDNWIDETITTKEVTTPAKSLTLRRWWYHRGESWANSERTKWLEITGASGEQLGWAGTSVSKTVESTTTMLDEAIMYMRPQTITVEGSNYLKNTDNLVCYFDGIKVALTPVKFDNETTMSTTVGSNGAGTIRANSKGRFKATFNIPKNVPCGYVEVIVMNDTNSGNAIYCANGRKTESIKIIEHTKTIINPYDPLAQSFQLDATTIITSVGLYFAAKDASKNIVVQLRNMVNGYPGTTCYAEVSVHPDDILVSDDATKETIIDFGKPIIINADEQYCFTILSDSNEYTMWIAELGGTDVTNNNLYLATQPYVAGVLFSSSNELTWTAHQTSDLKFNLYKANFTGAKGVVIYEPITATNDFNRFLVAGQYFDQDNSGIEWSYRFNEQDTWKDIETYVDYSLSALAKSMQLKAELSYNNTAKIPPLMSDDSINIITFVEEAEGTYVSRMITLENTYDQVNVSFEGNIPTGTGVSIYFRSSKSGNVWTEIPKVNEVEIELYWKRYEYQYNISNSTTPPNSYAIKIELRTNNLLVRPRLRKLMSIMRKIGT